MLRSVVIRLISGVGVRMLAGCTHIPPSRHSVSFSTQCQVGISADRMLESRGRGEQKEKLIASPAVRRALERFYQFSMNYEFRQDAR